MFLSLKTIFEIAKFQHKQRIWYFSKVHPFFEIKKSVAGDLQGAAPGNYRSLKSLHLWWAREVRCTSSFSKLWLWYNWNKNDSFKLSKHHNFLGKFKLQLWQTICKILESINWSKDQKILWISKWELTETVTNKQTSPSPTSNNRNMQ